MRKVAYFVAPIVAGLLLAPITYAQTLPSSLMGSPAAKTPAPATPAAAPATPPAATPAPATPAPDTAAAAPAPEPIAAAEPPCANPNALGVSRVVQIDTTGGPGFGFEHFKQLDFLRDKEVVLTFDDGPWPVNTPMVLKALADQCTKALFFPIGEHATWHPELLKEVAAAGQTIGSHTWSHQTLTKKGMTDDQAKEEIEKGISAVAWALGKPPSPFFRFPALQHPPAMVTYLGDRNIAIFSCDFDSFDFKLRNGKKIIDRVMSQLQIHGKGIILMHDFQRATAEALPELLARMKAGGYKIVQVKAKQPEVTTLPQYDAEVLKDDKLQTVTTKPVSSVVQTIAE